MNRLLACSAVLLLATQVAICAEPSKKVTITGQFTGGVKITASFTVTGATVSGGTGTITGTDGSHQFTITKVSTKTKEGTVVATGSIKLSDRATSPVTLTAKVPSGAQSFSYVVNGKTYTLTGTGTVTVQ